MSDKKPAPSNNTRKQETRNSAPRHLSGDELDRVAGGTPGAVSQSAPMPAPAREVTKSRSNTKDN